MFLIDGMNKMEHRLEPIMHCSTFQRSSPNFPVIISANFSMDRQNRHISANWLFNVLLVIGDQASYLLHRRVGPLHVQEKVQPMPKKKTKTLLILRSCPDHALCNEKHAETFVESKAVNLQLVHMSNMFPHINSHCIIPQS